MSLIVYWFLLEFGLLSGIFVFLGVLLTPWFTYLGRDLWFCIWTNFLPLVISLFVLKREHELQRPSEFLILLYANIAILINFIFNGYEWVSTTLIMANIPFFFYWRKGEWPYQLYHLVHAFLPFRTGYDRSCDFIADKEWEIYDQETSCLIILAGTPPTIE